MKNGIRTALTALVGVPAAFIVGFVVIGPQLPTRGPADAAGAEPVSIAGLFRSPARQRKPGRARVKITLCPAQPASSPGSAANLPHSPQSSVPVSKSDDVGAPAQPGGEPGSTEGLYRVRVGAFSTMSAARSLSDDLLREGFCAAIHILSRDGAQFYCVQVGAFADPVNAEQLAADLRRAGREVYVARPE